MISTKGRYALRVMLDLAQQDTDSFIPLDEIAERQGISKKYLDIYILQMGFLKYIFFHRHYHDQMQLRQIFYCLG